VLESLTARDLIAWAIQTFGDRFAISTSLQVDDLVVVDMAVAINPAVRVFTLDTGRLPQETYDVIDAVRQKYGISVEVVAPDHNEVARMTTRHGANLFYRDTSLRKLCCHIRKTRPLERTLAGLDAWASGLRREQSPERASTPKAEYAGGRSPLNEMSSFSPVIGAAASAQGGQGSRGCWKLNPLAEWTSTQLEEYVTRHDVPRHPLTARGYPSIGCAPCTRAVAPGEHERAGRWWWEQNDSKECGLHVSPDGQMRRTLDVLLDDILVR
jgi:thioredoxin-dependent adenylylsulfate APS reductase